MVWFPWLCPLLCSLLFSLNFQASVSSSLLSLSPAHQCSNFERDALLQFKSTFSINSNDFSYLCERSSTKSNPRTNSWNEGTDCCKWDGVSCDSASGHVIGIDLSCSLLYGTIPSNSSLFLLRHLQRLNLAFNDFRGSKISPEFGGFTSLIYLNLSHSSFSGKIPYNISKLSTLVIIDLSQVTFTTLEFEEHTFRGLVRNLTKVRVLVLRGVNMSAVDPGILMNISSSLVSLSLNHCDLRGRFPQNIFHLPNLRVLSFYGNPHVFGHLPSTNWRSPLKYLSLSDTSYFGELPDSISNLGALNFLDLASCIFSGSLPRSLGNLSHLTYLDLADNGFTGQMSFSLSKLTQLQYLRLSYNQLVGSIPDQVSTFHKLSYVDLSHNLLSGTLPSWLYSLSSLRSVNLMNNQLTGEINEFEQKSLEQMYVGNNKLQGPIPKSIFKLENLTVLGLSYNNLSDIVEFDMLSKLRNLYVLDLSNNHLSVKPYKNVNVTLPNLQVLYLSSCKIEVFPQFLRDLTDLQRLDLSNNGIQGMVPKWFEDVGKFSLTYLNLSHNSLTFIEKFRWNEISVLDLQSNLLQGKLPFLPSTIIFFSVSNNSLSGGISSQICNASYLHILDLSRNNLDGTIPQCLVNATPILSVLNLQMNKFHGNILLSFPNDCQFKYINFNGNQLEGRLPQSMSSCRYMEVLDLGNNKINDTFPRWLEALPELQVLVLRSNLLHGHIEGCNSAHCFSKLQILDLSNNDFSGPLPTKNIAKLNSMTNPRRLNGSLQYLGEVNGFGNFYAYSAGITIQGVDRELVKIIVIFSSIDLSNNKFEGEISRDFGKLVALRGLNLSHNNFNGHIPPSIGNLSDLEWLDLSSNRLVGMIPMQLADLTSLSSLNLSYNQLIGPIPQGKQFNTFENGSFEGNLGLCGFPLTKACNEDETQQPPPQSTNESEYSEIGFGWKVVLLGYGCGFVFGVAVGYLVILRRKPKWLANWLKLNKSGRGGQRRK